MNLCSGDMAPIKIKALNLFRKDRQGTQGVNAKLTQIKLSAPNWTLCFIASTLELLLKYCCLQIKP